MELQIHFLKQRGSHIKKNHRSNRGWRLLFVKVILSLMTLQLTIVSSKRPERILLRISNQAIKINKRTWYPLIILWDKVLGILFRNCNKLINLTGSRIIAIWRVDHRNPSLISHIWLKTRRELWYHPKKRRTWQLEQIFKTTMILPLRTPCRDPKKRRRRKLRRSWMGRIVSSKIHNYKSSQNN